MIFKPASPVNCSTSGCSSSHTSTSGNGNRIVTSFLPSTPNFFVDFFTHVWYFSAIAALLSKRVLTPDSVRVRVESRYFLLQVSTKGGTTSTHHRELGNATQLGMPPPNGRSVLFVPNVREAAPPTALSDAIDLC